MFSTWREGGGAQFGAGASPATRPQLCAEDVKDFLEQMAVVRINKGWEFLLPCDGEFIRKHPDVVQRQHMLWTGIQAKYEPAGRRGSEPDTPLPGARPGCVGGAVRADSGPRAPSSTGGQTWHSHFLPEQEPCLCGPSGPVDGPGGR